MKTKIILSLTCLILVCNAFGAITINGLSYNLNETDKTATLISYDENSGTDLIVPDKIVYGDIEYVVTSIAGTNSQITSITIPTTIKTITASFTSSTLKSVHWLGSPEAWCRLSFSSYKNNPLNVARKLYDINGEQVTKIDLSNQSYVGKYSLYHAEIDTLIFGTSYYYGGDEVLSGWLGTTVFWNVKTCGGWGGDIGPFKNCRSNITTFVFGDSVAEIPEYLCYGMRIEKVRIPANVQSIGYYAFQGCSNISEIEYNSKATSSIWSTSTYGDGPFRSAKSSVKKVIVGDGVTHILSMMFNGFSALQEVTLPASLNTIGTDVFKDCSSLRRINYAGTPYDWYSINFSGLTSNPLYYAGCIYTDDEAWNNVQIPEGITTIKSVSFANAKFLADSLMIPESVVSIGEYALYRCNSQIITMPSSITSIGSNAFEQCYALNKIYYQGTSSQWAAIRFYNVKSNPLSNNCNLFINGNLLEEATIDTISVSNYAFYNCRTLKRLALGETVQSLGTSSFANCVSLSSINLPKNLQQIKTSCFENCNGIDSIDYACSNLTYVENNPFNSSANKISSLKIQNSVETIPPYIFYQFDKISGITIPNSVTSIGKSAFEACSHMRNLTIGSGIDNIKEDAFKDCTGLLSIKSLSELPAIIDSTSFKNVSNTVKINIPCGTISDYQAAQYWNSFGNYIEELPYEVNITSEDKLKGTIQVNSAANCLDDVIIFEAVPRSGYMFEKWSDNNVQNPRSMIVDGDISLIAYFYSNGENVDNQTISYWDKDSVLLDSEDIKIHLPIAPEIAGFTFVRWVVMANDLNDGVNVRAVYIADNEESILSEVVISPNSTQKLIRDGNVYILTEDKTYTITGQKVQ